MNIENEIMTEIDGFNKALIFKHNSKNIMFYTNSNSYRIPNDSKGELEISDECGVYIFIGIGNKEQYLNLCKLIKEINYESN